jgi:hypothetical protein
MRFRYGFLIILFLLQQGLLAQSIWPGDVNNNGIVNKVDILYLGYAFGETGAKRTTQSSEWAANELPTNWEGNFPNGLNFAYADCNGDGKIDLEDVNVITSNAGFSRAGFSPDEVIAGIPGMDPQCGFENEPSINQSQSTFQIGLGSTELPLENMSGIALIIDVEPDIIGALYNFDLVYNPDAWIEPATQQNIQGQLFEQNTARLKVAFSKNDRIPISGAGPIASFIIEGDLVDFLTNNPTSADTLSVSIDSIIVLDDALNPIPVEGDTVKVFLDENQALTTSIKEHPKLQDINLYPNPNKGLLLIESQEVSLEKVEIINQLGQTVFRQSLENTPFQSIDFQKLPKGAYWIKIYTPFGIKTKNIQKL